MAALGHTCDTVENGALAIQALETGNYDLILMDIRMPEVSGPEATRMIRSSKSAKKDIPIVAITADAMEEHRRGYLEAGMNAVATKPIDRGALALSINAAMNEEIHIAMPRQAAPPPPLPAEPSVDQGGGKAAEAAVGDFLKSLGLSDEANKG